MYSVVPVRLSENERGDLKLRIASDLIPAQHIIVLSIDGLDCLLEIAAGDWDKTTDILHTYIAKCLDPMKRNPFRGQFPAEYQCEVRLTMLVNVGGELFELAG